METSLDTFSALDHHHSVATWAIRAEVRAERRIVDRAFTAFADAGLT